MSWSLASYIEAVLYLQSGVTEIENPNNIPFPIIDGYNIVCKKQLQNAKNGHTFLGRDMCKRLS